MQSPFESENQPTWPSILTIAKHTPRTSTPKPDLPSAEQQTLIDSLRSLRLTNPPASNSESEQSDLKAAIADILSEYEDEDESPTSTSTKLEKEQWENLHAFLAFITKERIVRLEDVGIHTLRVALERGEHHHYHHHRYHHQQQGTGAGVPPGTGKRKKMAVFVSCAAIWALVMGEELWERRHETEEFPVGLSLSPSHRESGAAGAAAPTVSKSRWQMWIDRFQFLSLADDLDIKTRELAAEAAAVMRRVT
ncbi:hypothetical protein CNMCM7691_007444 [Aspergillus felis]|uniref:Uncharacterized protein n=1 Tax=Aspergillus felis TaxID=1287682 RepID=A0A8H6V5L0_9EURO|nr:hypothetical protein CNMCM7691_007444 [Aspergillus felis]